MESIGIPRVDPFAKQSAFRRAYTAFLCTDIGRWTAINVAARVDPYLLRATRGTVGMGISLPDARIVTVGAKSGKPRPATVLYFNDGDDVIVVASSFGREKHPSWYYNLRANPEATLEANGMSGRYRATEVTDENERSRLWTLADRVYRGYADYRDRTAKTGRTIPIMRLQLID